MKRKKILLAAGICLLIGCSGNVNAQAASQPQAAIPVAQNPARHMVTGKGRIKASAKAVSIKFRRSKYKLKLGQKKRIKVTIRPSIATEKPVFASDNTMIADFINGNLLQAKLPGTTYITATLSNGRRARCKIIVKNKKTNANKENPPLYGKSNIQK